MLTDDQLTTQLRAAFRDATDDLRYAGRVPTPRNPYAVAVPAAASVAVVATLAGVWATSGPDEPVRTPQAHPSQAAHRMITSTIHVAGYTFSYRHAAGVEGDDDLRAVTNPGAAPADAKPVDPPAGAIDGVRAWVGTDPASGDNAIWVQSPSRNDGRVFALMSSSWSQDELVDLFRSGSPRPVPAVTQ
jgi:hypothetical protein